MVRTRQEKRKKNKRDVLKQKAMKSLVDIKCPWEEIQVWAIDKVGTHERRENNSR